MPSILYWCSVFYKINFYEFLDGSKVQGSIFKFTPSLTFSGSVKNMAVCLLGFHGSFPLPYFYLDHLSFSDSSLVPSWFSF